MRGWVCEWVLSVQYLLITIMYIMVLFSLGSSGEDSEEAD